MICVGATYVLWVILLIECNVDNTLAIWARVRSNLGKDQVKVRSRSGQVRSHFDVDCEDLKRCLSVSVVHDELNDAFCVNPCEV